ncbi:PKD domain-containing protein [Mucilaginibacter sp. BJC16-A38]|uniref:PKD domain-containing protein n=1 Tax=Mucilaginibacter phenanthrenivorans TaxID=1234842 RepID=UPI002157CC6A|nr:PKD domain-containing protein [Mucilaginibacter phenanthrenivorans]MCR8561461.1 PKD domain-containing protein [Mucilaginibacter phenanthrenivorans]
MKLNLIKACAIVSGIMAIGAYVGCKPDPLKDGDNGLVAKNVASFTINPVSGKPNNFVLKAEETGVTAVKWDLGDGGGSNIGTAIDSIFVPDAGTYNVVLTTAGVGGATQTASKTLTVATSDPKAGNLVVGGKMTAADDASWKHITISPGVTFVLDPTKNMMVASGGGFGHAAVYQAINLVAGQKYAVDMLISGSGATDTWFETYVGSKVPAQGTDYSDGGIKIALNTWNGCGKTAFSGKLSAISCNGAGNTFTVPTTGTYYLLIKSGGSNLGVTGISFTNVTLRGVQ